MTGAVAVVVVVVVSMIIIAVIGAVVALEVNGAVSVSASSVTRAAVAVFFLVPVAVSGAEVVGVVAVVAVVAMMAVGSSVVAVVAAATVTFSVGGVLLSSSITARWLPLGVFSFRSIITEEVIFLTFGH